MYATNSKKSEDIGSEVGLDLPSRAGGVIGPGSRGEKAPGALFGAQR